MRSLRRTLNACQPPTNVSIVITDTCLRFNSLSRQKITKITRSGCITDHQLNLTSEVIQHASDDLTFRHGVLSPICVCHVVRNTIFLPSQSSHGALDLCRNWSQFTHHYPLSRHLIQRPPKVL